MSFSSFLVAAVLVFMLVALMREYLRPGLILFTAVVLLLVAGIITPEEAIKGFSNKGMITVALLYLVSEGVRKSGILERIVFHMLPKKNASITSAGFRFYPIVSFISAFFNNTPVVVIFAPMIKNWARKMKLPPTKFLIPLSYATVIGGICTLIGTTTNLVLHGMLIQEYKEEATAVAQGGTEGILMRFGIDGMSMFELTKVGIFIALAGLIYLIFFSKYLLPNNRMADEEFDDSSLAPGMIRHEVLLGNRFPGLGKTLICEKILPVILGRKIKTVNARDMGAQIDELVKERAVIVDDLGKEPVEYKNYGNVRKPFFELCDAAERNGILLIINTNLSPQGVNNPLYPDSIEHRYGREVLDRLHTIVKAVLFRGDSLRR